MHIYISKKIISFLFEYYYKYILKSNEMEEDVACIENRTLHLEKMKKRYHDILDSDSVLLKPSFFVYLQFYFFSLFFYNLTHSHTIWMILSLHSFHICRLTLKHFLQSIDYPQTPFLRISRYLYSFLLYLFCMHFTLCRASFYNKILFSALSLPIYTLSHIRYVYKKRLDSIHRDTPIEPDLFVVTSDKEEMMKMYRYTRYFTFSLFLWIFSFLYIFLM